MSTLSASADCRQVERWASSPLTGFLAVGLVGCLALLPRLGQLTLRGEETRRARVAWEMIASGDWLSPRLQGDTYTSRPPLGSWLIAAVALARGQVDLVAARAPSLAATLLAAWLAYFYSRNFVSPASALAAGWAYLTSWMVLEMGRLAETEAVLALLAGAALLLWHLGYSRGWPPAAYWTAGYSLAALAALAKGLQPLAYFGATTWLFLLVRREGRSLVSVAHACGLLAGAAIVAAWWLPYLREVGWDAACEIWVRNVRIRYTASDTPTFFTHLITYPVEALVSLLPWSALFLGFVRRELRQSWGPLLSPAIFLSLALGVALASCWLSTESRTRYLMPVAPCVAALTGLVVERIAMASTATGIRRGWRDFTGCFALAIFVVALGVAAASAGGWLRELPLWQAPKAAILLAGGGLAAAAALWWSGRTAQAPLVGAALVSLAMIGAYDGLWMNWLLRRAETTADRVAQLRRELPPDARLVSFGPLHHAFLFHSQSEIDNLPWPRREVSVPEGVEYFCFHETREARPALPFAWEKVAEISCDRHRREEPFDRVVVGRRLTTRVAREPSRALR